MAILLAGVAIVSMAASSPPASAQSVELTAEFSGYHCSSVWLDEDEEGALGGCTSFVNSEAPIALEAFGSLVSACHSDHVLALDEDGYGYLFFHSLGGLDCTTPPCGPTGDSHPWPVEMYEAAGATRLEARLCVVSSALGTVNCHLAGIAVDPTDHTTTELTLNALPCEDPLSFVHLTGTFTTFAVGGLEIQHL